MNKKELIERIEGLKNLFGNKAEYIEIDAAVRLISELDEPQSIKLKDVIARIEKFDLATKAVWINEILYKLGSDYGLHKYYAGYEQGKFDGAMEREKVTVPQFVADWYEENKDDFEIALFRCIDHIPSVYDEGDLNEFEEWIIDGETKPFQTLVNMHQFGYEVEKEKRYTVRMRTTNQPLFYNSLEKKLFFSLGELATQFTFKQLEEAGFGEVFDSPLFEVEEVQDDSKV